MRSPADMGIIEIDITNACIHSCSNCTRFCGHHKKPFFMDYDFFTTAVDSLADYPGQVGIMGGEPTLHPEFERIVEYVREKRKNNDHISLASGPISDMQFHIWARVDQNPKAKMVLLSSLSKSYYKHFEVINDTFEHQLLNDHGSNSMHQALLMTRKELKICDDEWIKRRDSCWIQNTWSASITPKGAFFCEVAGALDMLLDGPGGWNVEPGWWRRKPDEFGDQLKWCEYCSGCIDAPKRLSHDERDDVSPFMYQRLLEVKSPKAILGKVVVRDPDEFESYRSETYASGNEYIAAGNNQRITDANHNLFPEHIAWIPVGQNQIQNEKGWVLRCPESLKEELKTFVKHKIWNPGCFYRIGDSSDFFNTEALAFRKGISAVDSANYSDDKYVYVSKDDPWLFLLGGETKRQRKVFNRKEKHVLIYGAGVVGKEVIKRLHAHNIFDFDVVVTEIDDEKTIDGHKLMNISNFKGRRDVMVVIATMPKLHDEIISQIQENDIPFWQRLA